MQYDSVCCDGKYGPLALWCGVFLERPQFDEQEYERYKRHCSKTNRAPITREEAAEATKRKQAAMK